MRSLKAFGMSFGVGLMRRPSLVCLPFFALAAAATWAVRDNFFFWDTTQLASEHAQFVFSSHFSTFLLPDVMDSGHPPTFGFYLAAMWFLFGKTLTVSHLAMLPFLLGIVWQAFGVASRLMSFLWALLFLLLLSVNPVVASQAILVSPDVPLLFFFLLALNSIFRRNKIWLAFAIVGLAFKFLIGFFFRYLFFSRF